MNPLEFELDDGPTIEALLMAYPEGVVVSELNHPSEDIEDKVAIAQALYKEGILIIEDEATAPSSAVGKSAESIKQAAENEVNDDESKNVEAGENKKLSLFDD